MALDLSTAGALDTSLWAARARNSLERIRLGPIDSGVLTSAEQRIAELAATGKTNHDIASTLAHEVSNARAATCDWSFDEVTHSTSMTGETPRPLSIAWTCTLPPHASNVPVVLQPPLTPSA